MTSLTRKKEFNELYKKSFRIYGGSFVFRVLLSDSTKISIGVSKKYGNAVYRNRVRRLIREIARKREFPYPLHILISQVKPLKSEQHLKQDISYLFDLMGDKYLVRQLSLESTKKVRKTENMPLPSKALFEAVYLYKKYISGGLPHSCRYVPSCSMYAMEALRLHGFFYASFLIAKRILSCNPFGGSGADPVPYKKPKK